jgi:DNA-binding MarR family transcriptional regulator
MILNQKEISAITQLHRLAFRIERHADQILLEKLGIGFSQFKILHELDSNPVYKQNQLALALGQTEASVSRQMKLMRSMGLIYSNINPNNRREHITTLSAKGTKLRDASTESLNKYYSSIVSSTSSKDLDRLTDILSKLSVKA